MFNGIRKITQNIARRSLEFRGFIRSLTMDGEEDLSEYLPESHQILKGYISKRNTEEQDLGVIDYLKDVKFKPVEDFPEGLEWFNVSEPLSFEKHLKGKVVLLDFFTYCCINCMHILPDLKDIENEFSIEDGLVVIGVHSAKFENEKVSKNILAAVQRYNIGHPVVNDNNSTMWRNCDVHCWPTLLLLGPDANPIVMLMGEGHRDDLHLYIRNALAYYKSKNQISDHTLPLESAYHLLPDLKGPLLFPGKITNYLDENGSELLAISDTGNNRILILRTDGTVLHQVGGTRSGFKDGTLEEALFNAPQGLTFYDAYILYVADTENHAIRKIDLKNNQVLTVVGTGEQGHDYKGGQKGAAQEISSPWDVCIYKTADFGSTQEPTKNVVIIAMAGTHQIWALFLDDIVWWKNQSYSKDTCVCIAGSGREENRNNQYPHAAAFAQPSGLALNIKNKEVYIADSESSSVRRLSLVDGKVTAVVGGDRNPNNLFAFGDKDGKQYDAKLQHLLGLAMSRKDDILFVMDTYNHKLKKVDVSTNTIITLGISETFNEPAAGCTSFDNKKLYLADTNNHLIKILEFNADYCVTQIKQLSLKCDLKKPSLKINKSKYQVITAKPLVINSKGGKIIQKIALNLSSGLELTKEAPQSWTIDLPNSSWSCVPTCGTNVQDVDVVFSIFSNESNDVVLNFVYNIVTCVGDTCQPKNFIIEQPIKFLKDAPVASNSLIKLIMDQTKIVIE